MKESTKRKKSSGFTLIELLIVLFSVCGFIGGLGEGWNFGLGWSLLYGLLGSVLGFSTVVVPIFVIAAGNYLFQGVFGKPDEQRTTIDPSKEGKPNKNSGG